MKLKLLSNHYQTPCRKAGAGAKRLMNVQHCKASYSAVWQTYATSYKHSEVETKDGQQGRQTQGHIRGHVVPDEACSGPKWD